MESTLFNYDIEEMVIGCCLQKESDLLFTKDFLTVEDFYKKEFKIIYSAMLILLEQGKKVDTFTVEDYLSNNKIGGISSDFLDNVVLSLVSNRKLQSNINVILEYSKKRKLDKLLNDLTKQLPIKSIDDVLDELNSVNNLDLSNKPDETKSVKSWIDKYIEELKLRETDGERRPLTLFQGWDEMITLKKATYNIVASRPAQGKSALGMNLTKNFCEQGFKTLFVSLEMPEHQVINRLVANISRIPNMELDRKKKFTDSEWKSILKARETIKKYDIEIFDKSGVDIDYLASVIRRMKKQGKIDIVVIDYIGLINTRKYKDNQTQKLSYVSRTLKQLCLETELPMFILAQLNRESDGAKSREPILSDLRQSGQLEQDADSVTLIHEIKFNEKGGKQNLSNMKQRMMKLIVAKNRHGKIGRIDFNYYGDYIEFIEKRWNDMSKRYEEVPLTKIEQITPIELNDDDLPF